MNKRLLSLSLWFYGSMVYLQTFGVVVIPNPNPIRQLIRGTTLPRS